MVLLAFTSFAAVTVEELVMISGCTNTDMVDRPHPPLSPCAAPEDLAIVYVVDDDASMREMLASLFRSAGLRIEVFASASEFRFATRIS